MITQSIHLTTHSWICIKVFLVKSLQLKKTWTENKIINVFILRLHSFLHFHELWPFTLHIITLANMTLTHVKQQHLLRRKQKYALFNSHLLLFEGGIAPPGVLER